MLGAGGLLGSNVVVRTVSRGDDVVGTNQSSPPAFDIPFKQLDIEKNDSFRELLEMHAPEVVVNCAAMTDADGCENEPMAAMIINGEMPGRLATVCAELDIQFVHVSTDYVFDDEATTPYDESATPNPIQEYGQSKLLGEQRVAEAHEDALITRLSFIWGIDRFSEELTSFPV